MRGKFRKNKHIVMFLQTLDNYKYSIIFTKMLIINIIQIPQIQKIYNTTMAYNIYIIIISASAA